MRGSRGGSNKHGHYTCKYSTLCSLSAFPLSAPVYFPITNKPVASRTSGGDSAVPSRCGRSSAGCLLAVPARPDLPGPGAVLGRAAARTCLHGRDPRGPPGATSRVWDGEQSRLHSPPARQTSSLEYLPVFQSGFPWGPAKQKLL